MANIADKVVRVEQDVYGFVTDFANEHDLKISETVSMFIRFCMDKEFDIVQREVTLIEKRSVLEETE